MCMHCLSPEGGPTHRCMDTEGTSVSRLLPWASPGLRPADQQRPSQNMGQILSLPPKTRRCFPSSLRQNPSSPRADRSSATRPYAPSTPPGLALMGDAVLLGSTCCSFRLQEASPSSTQLGLFTPRRLLPMSPPKGPSPPTRSANGNS